MTPGAHDPRSTTAPQHLERLHAARGRLNDAARVRAWWFVRGAARGLRPFISRDAFDALYGLGRVGYVPRVGAPRTLVEKLLWLKRHYRHPLMPTLADKLAVRDYVSEVAPELRLPTVYTVSERAESFDFAALPERAVIKPTHASGLVAFWQPGSDPAAIRRTLRTWIDRDHARHLDEWFYASLTPRIFAEQDLRAPTGAMPPDYKVLVLDGSARYVQVFSGRGKRLTRTMFDRAWAHVPCWRSEAPGGPPIVVEERDRPTRPERLDDMLAAAERLAAPFPFARVDLYAIGGELYFGEITFMPAGGYLPLAPYRYDLEAGSFLTLPASAGGPDRT